MIPGLLGTLSGGFRPTDIGGLELGVSGDTIVGLAGDAAVASWNDFSGQGRNLTQGTGAMQPVYKTGILNGSPVVRFDGVQTYLSVPDLSSLSSGAIVFLVFRNTVEGNGNHVYVMSSAAEPSTFLPYNGDGRLYDATFSSARKEYITATGIVAGWNIYAVNSRENLWKNWLNGVSVYSTGTNAVGAPATPYLGKGITGIWAGDIAELLIYSTDLSFVQIGMVMSYLGSKYALTVHLEPVNTVAPALSAAGWTVGQVASCDTGTWTNEPTSYAYQWQRKDGGYTNIPGATSSSYLLAAADAGKNVRCGVTPSNAFATGTVAYSLDSDLIL